MDMAATACGEITYSISTPQSFYQDRCIVTRELLAQDVHIIALVYGYRNLHQVTKTTKANVAPEHNALLPYKAQQHGEYRSWVSFLTNTGPLSDGHPELIAECDLAPTVIFLCPVLDNSWLSSTILASVNVLCWFLLCNTDPKTRLIVT